jgi:hypothetical protein
MAGAWEAASFRDVYLPTRLHLISGRRLPALAWSAKGRFLNGQSRVYKTFGIIALCAGSRLRRRDAEHVSTRDGIYI